MSRTFIVTLEAMPDAVPADVRLRQLLKLALRGMRFRAVCVEPVPQTGDQLTKDCASAMARVTQDAPKAG